MTAIAATALGEALQDVRQRTLDLVAPFSDAELERVQHPLMSPLVWDLGHIAAYEDLWLVHRHGGEPLLRGDLAGLYDAFETPRDLRGEIPFLRGQDVFDYIAAVRERALAALDRVGPGDGTLFEMVIRHEAQHNETMRQTLFLGGLPGGRPDPVERRAQPEDGWIDIPAGPSAMGAPAGGFAFDNERPRHRVDVPAFRIARRPVTNATWMHFVEGGGYERREWWSSEGWSWKEEYDITRPEGWGADGPPDVDRPVLHVSWFEADAFARSRGARLPTEAEWEKAATWARDPLPDTGLAWEWTSSRFDGYPGFVAHPYREYSEVFFGDRYRVLRGASWATCDRVRSPTFRNWDLPLRRQIFAGVRLAKDVT
jgi:iron(II)-dependent oxidoreductase